MKREPKRFQLRRHCDRARLHCEERESQIQQKVVKPFEFFYGNLKRQIREKCFRPHATNSLEVRTIGATWFGNMLVIMRGLTFELGSFGGGRENRKEVSRSGRVNRSEGLILGGRCSGGSVWVLRFLGGGGFFRGLNEVLGVLLVFGFNVVDRSDRLQDHRPRSRFAHGVIRLAGVNTKAG